MNFNVLDLYKIYAENPKAFVQVLRNIYAYECRYLRERCLEVIDYVGSVNAESGFIIDDLEKLEAEFIKPIKLIAFFRKVNMQGHLDADSFINSLENNAIIITMGQEDYRNEINGEKASKDMEKALHDAAIKGLSEKLDEVFLNLKELDEKI